MLLITAIALSSVGIATGAITLVIKRGEAVAGMMIFGLALVSGALFPVSVLPDWIQPLRDVAPTRLRVRRSPRGVVRGERLDRGSSDPGGFRLRAVASRHPVVLRCADACQA